MSLLTPQHIASEFAYQLANRLGWIERIGRPDFDVTITRSDDEDVVSVQVRMADFNGRIVFPVRDLHLGIEEFSERYVLPQVEASMTNRRL
jgi:DNA primase